MTFRKTGRQSRAYMLRCWIEDGHPADRPRDWRFSLHDPDTATRHGFTSLQALMAFLNGELERALRADPPADEPGSPGRTDVRSQGVNRTARQRRMTTTEQPGRSPTPAEAHQGAPHDTARRRR